MSNLTDALAEVETDMRAARKIFGDQPSDMDDWAVVAAAARLVAEAPEVWWCEEHDAGSSLPDGICAAIRFEPDLIPDSCRMVRKLLVDPPEAE